MLGVEKPIHSAMLQLPNGGVILGAKAYGVHAIIFEFFTHGAGCTLQLLGPNAGSSFTGPCYVELSSSSTEGLFCGRAPGPLIPVTRATMECSDIDLETTGPNEIPVIVRRFTELIDADGTLTFELRTVDADGTELHPRICAILKRIKRILYA